MSPFETQVLSDLSVLKSQMKELLGNGQPGRLHGIEQRVDSHEAALQRAKGIGAVGGVLLTLANIAFDLLRR